MTKMHRIEATDSLLKFVAQKLAGRPDCKGVEYWVHISAGQPQKVKFEPAIYVFPNRVNRKRVDKLPVIQHAVITYNKHTEPQVSSVEFEQGQDGSLVIKSEVFIPGHYQYRVSVDQKCRKWFRL